MAEHLDAACPHCRRPLVVVVGKRGVEVMPLADDMDRLCTCGHPRADHICGCVAYPCQCRRYTFDRENVRVGTMCHVPLVALPTEPAARTSL